MAATYSPQTVRDQIQAAVRKIRENLTLLSQLDGAIGDGDHGTSMGRAMDAIDNALAKAGDTPLKTWLYDTGWAVMGCDGGSTSPLLGSFLTGMSDAAPEGEACDGAALIAVFVAGVEKMHKQSRAQIGDKTMMDALLPAANALRECDPADARSAFAQAAQAAAAGVVATGDMRAKFGRARNLGDRTIGHIDPGAQSMAFWTAGFAEALEDTG